MVDLVQDSKTATEKTPVVALLEKLKNSGPAKNRCLPLNELSNTQEQDLIANYVPSSTIKDCVHCLMLRLANGNNDKQVSEELLKKGTIYLKDLGLDDIKSDTNNSKIQYQSHYYFCITDKYLITNLPANKNITGLQTYIGRFTNKLYEITPLIDTEIISKLSEISFVEFQDGRLYNKSLRSNTNDSVLTIATEFLKKHP